MENQEQQLVTRITEANYILVTVNSNPTFDQLAAAIGLTLMLNKMDKYATAIFSGQVPSSLNFLNPEKTIEKTTDSLRDFIISLDKDKADKLRYKIEDNFVRIFISPYHSALSEKDFVYTMGDFNVDVVIALGITKREELDKVIVEQGRILHDATIATINTTTPSTLGTINWDSPQSSCLCEMLVDFSSNFKVEKLIDGQIANSLLSGIIEETAQFSNHKTTAATMAAGSKLLVAGANQQLVSKEVLSGNAVVVEIPPKSTAEPAIVPVLPTPSPALSKDEAFRIDHPTSESQDNSVATEAPKAPEPLIVKPPDEKISSTDDRSREAEENVEENDYKIPDVSGDIDQIAIAPIMNTPMMTHQSLVMGRPTISSQPPAPVPASNPTPVIMPTPALKPVEALNAQPVDLDQTEDVKVPDQELAHPPHKETDIDYGGGTNIEFSDPGSPPPVPPPIITT